MGKYSMKSVAREIDNLNRVQGRDRGSRGIPFWTSGAPADLTTADVAYGSSSALIFPLPLTSTVQARYARVIARTTAGTGYLTARIYSLEFSKLIRTFGSRYFYNRRLRAISPSIKSPNELSTSNTLVNFDFKKPYILNPERNIYYIAILGDHNGLALATAGGGTSSTVLPYSTFDSGVGTLSDDIVFEDVSNYFPLSVTLLSERGLSGMGQ